MTTNELINLLKRADPAGTSEVVLWDKIQLSSDLWSVSFATATDLILNPKKIRRSIGPHLTADFYKDLYPFSRRKCVPGIILS